ncbi:MAG: DegT/DnrJ/EryC1/StrS family aminotransferase [Pedosphaera sp.]|nr:DegT/DnrJ/EryC1/StrS family aminotransferase [Pedosphaera sp.]
MSALPNIPLSRPLFGEEEIVAVRRVLESGEIGQGREVEAFETAVATVQLMPHAVAVSSATAGLHLTYLALGIGPGDVVLIPSFAWPSAANMAVRVGAVPFFVDVDPVTANLTGEALSRGMRLVRERGLGKARAVVVVHQFGLPAVMEELLEVARAADLIVIEDAAGALAAKHHARQLGHFGRAAVFSFSARNAVSTGEGGLVVTKEPALADTIRALRNHGEETREGRRDFTCAGFNYRLTELQAAIGLAQLKRLTGILETKKSLASLYFAELDGRRGLSLPPNSPEHTWQTFMITLESAAERQCIHEACKAAGIETGPGSVAAHTTAVWGQQFLQPEDSCPASTRLATCGLALPLHPRLTDDDMRRVVATLKKALQT